MPAGQGGVKAPMYTANTLTHTHSGHTSVTATDGPSSPGGSTGLTRRSFFVFPSLSPLSLSYLLFRGLDLLRLSSLESFEGSGDNAGEYVKRPEQTHLQIYSKDSLIIINRPVETH